MNNPNMNFGTTNRVGGGVVPVTGRRRPMRTELTDEQKAEIREAFEIFDMDKDGALDFHEFKVKRRRKRISGSEYHTYLNLIGRFKSFRI